MPAFDNSQALLSERSVSPSPRYTPYGAKEHGIPSGISRVMHGRVQVSSRSIKEQLEDVKTQLTAATVPLSSRVQDVSQFVLQITAVATQTLECATVA